MKRVSYITLERGCENHIPTMIGVTDLSGVTIMDLTRSVHDEAMNTFLS
jgi:hypothetical protein